MITNKIFGRLTVLNTTKNMKKIITLIILSLTLNVFAQIDPIVDIPNTNFKNTLLNHSPTIDTNNDGEIQVSEAEAIVGKVRATGQNDLTGIEAFINITELDIGFLQMADLDLSQNTALITLHCDGSHGLKTIDISKNVLLEWFNCTETLLTSLDVSKNTALTYLGCNFNYQLTNLDVTQNTNLTSFYAIDNRLLTNLDISKNIALTTFDCSNNKFTKLDISKNNNITSFNALRNPSLSTICINPNQDTSKWNKDTNTQYSTDCEVITSTQSKVNYDDTILKAYNLQGREVPKNTTGELIILLYDNGKTEKVFND